MILLSLITSSYIMGWFLVKAPHAYKRIKKWNEDYLENAYTLIFDTTVPKGNTTAEKVLSLAKLVFPELRPDLYVSPLDQPTASTFFSALKNKYFRRKRFTSKQKVSEKFDYLVDSYTLDLVVKTPVGYFVVKDFKDKIVTLDDLRHLISVIESKFKKNVFRIICVAKEYDESFLDRERLEGLMMEKLKTNLNIDLLTQEEVGYSVLWIT
jgi:hypothetical protein